MTFFGVKTDPNVNVYSQIFPGFFLLKDNIIPNSYKVSIVNRCV